MSAVVDDILRLALQLSPAQVAYHEIGHGLLAHRCGREVISISVDSRAGTGLTRSEGPSSPLILLLVTIGGSRAERFSPGFSPCLVDVGCIDDQRNLAQALDLLAGSPVQRDFIFQDAIREVDAMLYEQRARLDELARLLLRRHTLEGRELRALLEASAPDSGASWSRVPRRA